MSRGRISSGETEVVNMASHDHMGEIFGDEVDGLDVPTDDLDDVEMLSEGPNGGGFASNSLRRHGMGKQLRDIPVPSSTEVVMDGEEEESAEGEDSADDLSSESEESEEENDQVEGRMRVGGVIVELDGGLLAGSKEVVRPKEIDSSSSQVDGRDVARAKNPAVISRGVAPFGFAPFGTTSSVGVGGGGDVVPYAIGGVRGASATPCGSTSEVVIGTIMEERDGEYVVVRHDDGSVELKKESESVMVKLEYFDSVKDPYRQRVLNIFRLHPSTFVGLGALSSMERRFVLVEFGLYLECLDGVKLSSARVDDMALLHKKLTSLKDNGLEVKWLFDRNDRLLAQLEVANWGEKVEQLRASLVTAMGTMAHLEEDLEKAKAVVVGLKEEEAYYVRRHKAASELATLDFDLGGSAGQGLNG